MSRNRFVAALLAAGIVLGAAACGSDDPVLVSADRPAPSDQPAPGGVAGACLEGSTECNDTPDAGIAEPGDAADGADRLDVDAARSFAKGLLGTVEADLPESVRIARRGAEQFALTEDYVDGRVTVELDDTDGSSRVVKATIELPGGPETFALQAG